MITIKVSKDIESIKKDDFKGFSFKELSCIIVAFGFMVSSILICVFLAGINMIIASYLSIVFAIPPIAVGFIEVNKMSLLELIKAKLTNVFRQPLVYESTEMDDYILELEEVDKTNG